MIVKYDVDNSYWRSAIMYISLTAATHQVKVKCLLISLDVIYNICI